MQASEFDEVVLHRVEVSKSLGISINAILRRVKVTAPDTGDKHVDLAGLVKGGPAELFKRRSNVVLLDVLGNVLVKVVVLGVTSVGLLNSIQR